jgi:hypothetical protein
MRAKIAATLAVCIVSAAVAEPGDLMDEKTNQLTNRGAMASMIGAAEVSELRCGLKGQIAAALRKADQMDMHFDLNDKVDYSDVLFFATNIMGNAKKDGWDKWCKKYREGAAKLFNTQ